jgi:hypothetical protein
MTGNRKTRGAFLAVGWLVLVPTAVVGIALASGNVGATLPMLLVVAIVWLTPPILLFFLDRSSGDKS